MSDLISRQAAIDALADMHCKSDEDGYIWIIRSDAWARIDALPSVTPKRKCGKWIQKSAWAWMWTCSYCGKDDAYAYSADDAYEPTVLQDFYCPNCGADMRGEQDESD